AEAQAGADGAMFVPQDIELGVDRMDLGPDLGIVLVGEPVPELCAVFAQSLDLGMDLFESTHDGFNGRHARGIPAESSALPEETPRPFRPLRGLRAPGRPRRPARASRPLLRTAARRPSASDPPSRARAAVSRPRGARTRRCRIAPGGELGAVPRTPM